jgi:TfoX/Sxy family transcriptional regulator of competence genes
VGRHYSDQEHVLKAAKRHYERYQKLQFDKNWYKQGLFHKLIEGWDCIQPGRRRGSWGIGVGFNRILLENYSDQEHVLKAAKRHYERYQKLQFDKNWYKQGLMILLGPSSAAPATLPQVDRRLGLHSAWAASWVLGYRRKTSLRAIPKVTI